MGSSLKELEEMLMECHVKNQTTMKFLYNVERLHCYIKMHIYKGKIIQIVWYHFSKISYPSKS